MLALAPPPSAAAGAVVGNGFSGRSGRGAAGSRCCTAAPSRCWRRASIGAAINLLTRHGIEVVLVADEQCCGALIHHLGRDGRRAGRTRAPTSLPGLKEAERDGLDAILVTTSGCGTVIKDYGYMLREDRGFRSAGGQGLGAGQGYQRVCRRPRTAAIGSSRSDIVVAYHAACSLQHGQKITPASQRIAFQVRIRGERCAGEPFVLRFGRHLQHSPA